MRIPATPLQPQNLKDVVKAVQIALVAPGISVFGSMGFLHFFKPYPQNEKRAQPSNEIAITEKDIVNNFLMPQP